jgi:hypothetical protein
MSRTKAAFLAGVATAEFSSALFELDANQILTFGDIAVVVGTYPPRTAPNATRASRSSMTSVCGRAVFD